MYWGVLPTHCISVSCIGMVDEHEDGVFVPSVSKWKNDFSNEIALFRTADGGAIRTSEMRRVGYPAHIRGNHASVSSAREESFEQIATVSLWQSKVHTRRMSASSFGR